MKLNYLALFITALMSAVMLSIHRHSSVPPPIFAAQTYQPITSVINETPFFNKEFLPISPATPQVHSASLVKLSKNNANILAAWFGGSREGAADVAIWSSERTEKGWSSARVLVDRHDCEVELGLNLRKLGNPVLTQDATNRIWLFFVIASLGGWSTSSIAYKISTDQGHTFGISHQLITSPFLNISTLVRGRPLLYADGSMAVPAYHELLGKFGLLLRLHPNGHLLSASNIGNGRFGFQPSLVAINSNHTLALLRRTGTVAPTKVLFSFSNDGGINWSQPQSTNLPNPDAGIAVTNSINGGFLLAYNPIEHGRHILSLAHSTDGEHWLKLKDLERGVAGDEYSYPFLITDTSGMYHLVYTWQRNRIVYVRFNNAWLHLL